MKILKFLILFICVAKCNCNSIDNIYKVNLSPGGKETVTIATSNSDSDIQFNMWSDYPVSIDMILDETQIRYDCIFETEYVFPTNYGNGTMILFNCDNDNEATVRYQTNLIYTNEQPYFLYIIIIVVFLIFVMWCILSDTERNHAACKKCCNCLHNCCCYFRKKSQYNKLVADNNVYYNTHSYNEL